VVFVLATTDPQRVLPTILSRCQRFDFRRIPLEALQTHLAWIAAEESIGITEEALHVVAQRAQGGLRDAESLLDQLSLLPAPIEAAAVWELLGAVPEEELLALVEAMVAADPLAVLETSRGLLERGRDPGAVLQGLAGLLRDLLLAGVAPDRLELTAVSPGLRPQLPGLARRLGKERLLHWQAQLRGSEQQLRQSVQPRLWLEVLLLGLLAAPQAAAAVSPAAVGSVSPPATAAPAGAGGGPSESATPENTTPATAATSAPEPAASTGPGAGQPAAAETANLGELWQQILAGLELPSTRMLLSQQAQLVRLDKRRAVVRVSGTWMAMVQSRLPLLEKAVASALGGARQLQLESGGEPPPGGERASAGAGTVPAAPLRPAAPAGPGVAPAESSAVGAAMPTPAPAATPAPPPLAPQKPPPQAQPAQAAAPLPVAAASSPAAAPAVAAGPPAPRSPLEERARRLADFFNGDVIEGLEDDVA
jgi:DNA polymerase-3 subunit gamma/tau